MKLTRSFLAIAIFFSLFSVSFPSFSAQTTFAQDTNIAIQRGYRTGYSDGYMAGYRDTLDNAAKKYDRHDEYFKADRAFNKDYGTLENYRDGYQQGFESGYETGFDKRSFDATIPVELKNRGIVLASTRTAQIEEQTPSKPLEVSTVTASTENTPIVTTPAEPRQQQAPENTVAYTPVQAPVISTATDNYNSYATNDSLVIIPTDTELIVELVDNIDTQRNREGDKFQARIVSPTEVSGAIIEGRISKIQKPGRIKRRAEMLLSFDRIVLDGNRWSNFNAIVTEVLPAKGDNVKRVDNEGMVEGKSSVKSDSVKVGASTGTGIVVGAIAGGPVGAAVGAGVGAAFGVGAAIVERGKDIKLNKNQQLRIKTAYETQIK